MANYARVTIVTQKKEYKPGEKLPSTFPSADLARLKKQGFVRTDDTADIVVDDNEDHKKNNSSGSDNDGFRFNEDDLNLNDDGATYLSKDELEKMKKKQNIVDYAATIGLTLSADSTKDELIYSVLNYIEEQQQA